MTHHPETEASMTEDEMEMDEAGELRTRLQFVEHDLQHVAQERDRAKDALAFALARHGALREAVKGLAEELDRVDELFAVADRLRAVVADAETCEHEWMEFGGPGDEWRECFLCGKQEDR